MTSLFHRLNTKLGHFDFKAFNIGLDYRRLFLDPIMAESTLLHETTHEYLAVFSNYGQALGLMCGWLPKINVLLEEQKIRILTEMLHAQKITQESIATCMSYQHIKSQHGKAIAEEWRMRLPDEYNQYLNNVLYIFEWSQKYRDLFTTSIPLLALDTNIISNIVENNLINKADAFCDLLKTDKYRPDWRFAKLLFALKADMWLLSKSKEVVCARCGIEYIPPASKANVADLLTYLSSFTPNKRTYTAEQVEEKPSMAALIGNTTIANINMDLGNNAEALWDIKDLLFYKDIIEAVFITLLIDKGLKREMDSLTNKDLKVSLLAFTRFGEKYTIALTESEAIALINSDLKEASLIIKWEEYSIENNRIKWLSEARYPDIIIYNKIENTNELTGIVNKNDLEVAYILVGASHGHPFGTLFFKINGLQPLHAINTYGNVKIQKFTEFIGEKAYNAPLNKVIDEKTYNNYFSAWCGLPWEINWFKSSLGASDFIKRF